MNGKAEPPKFVSDRRYLDAGVTMSRILELANAADADQRRISLGPINRTLLNEGASVDEYKAGLQRAIDEGLLELHVSRAYVLFTAAGAERFA